MGGRGGNSGFGGSGSGFPKLSGSENQVSWAENIRNNAMNAVESGLRNAKEDNSRINNFSTEAQVYVYENLRTEMKGQFSQITEASKIIDLRNRLTPGNINSMVNDQVRGMVLQRSNGWVYDKKLKKMVKPK